MSGYQLLCGTGQKQGGGGLCRGGYETFGRQLLCVRNSTAQQMQHEIETTLMTDEASRRRRSYRNHGQKLKKEGVEGGVSGGGDDSKGAK